MTQHPEGKATMLHQGDTQPVKVSLKVKALVFISLMILAVGASLSWYFLRQAQGVLTDELQRRALSLTKNLAHASQYGVLTRDEVILRQLVEGILQEDSVLLALITDAQGTVLAQWAKERADAASQPQATALAVQDIAVPTAQVTVPSVHYRIIGTRGVYHAVAPVETTQVMPRERMQHLTAELMLEGTASGAAPSAAPQQPSTTYLDANQQPEDTPQNAPQPGSQAPLGTATAEKGVTVGGAASRPAGTAIAPTKQRQSRSLAFKVGAVLAGGAALGTIYGLSRKTPPAPPGSGR